MSPINHPDVWRMTVTVDQAHVLDFESTLERHADAVTMFMDDLSGRSDGEGDWHVEAIFRVPPDRARILADLTATALAVGLPVPEATLERVPNVDWVAANLRDFPPIRAGRFFVHGSHWQDGVPAGHFGLKVDAGTAFGSGEHATTKGCLLALDRIAKTGHPLTRAVDLGTGSGILAIAMARLGAKRVIASDFDPIAVRVAQQNIKDNAAAQTVRAVVSDGWRNRALGQLGPLDLVTANILARPLCRFAPALAAHLAPHGRAVLSGLLEWQERMVMAVHERQGLRLKSRLVIDGWATLIIGR